MVIGRSTVIGRPAAYLLLKEDATVTIAHRDTRELPAITKQADIVVVGVGRAGFLKGEMLASGAVVIDAGINVTPQGLVGDVDVRSVATVASALSAVPGGLASVTTELLLVCGAIGAIAALAFSVELVTGERLRGEMLQQRFAGYRTSFRAWARLYHGDPPPEPAPQPEPEPDENPHTPP